MKNKTMLVVAIFVLHASTISQITNYNGKAKVFVDKFQKCVDAIKKIEESNNENKLRLCKVQADNALVQIEFIKKKDASFDIGPLMAQIEKYLEAAKEMVVEKNKKAREAGKNANKEGEGISGLFIGSNLTEVKTTGNADMDIANHKLEVEEFNNKVVELLNSGNNNVSKLENYIRNQITNTLSKIEKLEMKISTSTTALGLISYRELIGIETYWNGVTKFFTNIAEATMVHKRASLALQKLGSEEEVTDIQKNNYRELIKNKKIPVAVVLNAELEKEFSNVFKRSFSTLQILKINIISPNWTIVRNELTGTILGRKHSAAIVVKQNNGSCGLYYFHIGQSYNGSSYGPSSENARAYDGEILCENVK